MCPTVEEIRYVLKSLEKSEETAGGGENDGARVDATYLWHLGLCYPLPRAAEVLGVSQTKLKKDCRDKGIKQWPKRSADALASIVRSPHVVDEDKRIVYDLLVDSFQHRFKYDRLTSDYLRALQRRIYKKRNASRAAPSSRKRS